MNVRLGLALMICALAVAVLAAQDDPAKKEQPADEKGTAKKKLDDLPRIKELEKKEAGPGPAGGDDTERLRKIVERLHKNMDKSEEQLNKKDAGEATRKTQEEIVKDLDELIKQQSKGDGGGGGGGGGEASSGGKGTSGTKAGGAGASSSRSKRGSQTIKDKKGGASGNNEPDKVGKGEQKDQGTGNQTAKSDAGKEGKGGDGMGGKNSAEDKKDKNTIADLFKDVWGHLPQKDRQEMDAYAKERFLRKYEEILRQYYRTISEQDRRRDR